MERKSFLGIVIGAIIGLLILFLVYFFFFKDTPAGNNIRASMGNFFPISGDVDSGIRDNNDEPIEFVDTPPGDEPIPRLRRISHAPASGYIAFDRATTTTTIIGTTTVTTNTTEMAVRYIEKSTGHVFDTSDLTLYIQRLSNTTLGLSDNAQFSNSQSFILRKFNQDTSRIDMFVASLVSNGTTSTSTTPFRTSGSAFPRHPDAIALRETSLFSLYETPINAEGYITQITPVREVRVFSSPLSGWNIEWINQNNLLLTTKPNSGYDGYAYSYNPTTKKMTELFGPVSGLTAKVNHTLTAGLYSQSYEGSFGFYMAHFGKDTIFQLPSPTLPEKCVFSIKDPMIAYCAVPRPLPFGKYPEDWYKGKVQFDDAIVKIDIEKNTETLVVNFFDEGNVSIDAVNLSLNERETHLVFQNKYNNYVWSYDLR